MALVIPTGFGSAAFIFTTTAGTGPFVTTIGVDIGSLGGSFVNAANAIKSSFTSAFGSQLASQLTLDRVTLAVGQDGPGGSVDSDTAPAAMTGSASGQSAMAVAAIMRKVTNELGRSGRGRMFLPGSLNESDVEPNGSISPARRTALNTAGASFLTLLEGGGTPAVLLHADTSGLDTPTPIEGLIVSNLIGLVRGRIR